MDNKNIIIQINKLSEKTKERKIVWEIINKNLSRWVQKDEDRNFITTLQMQPLITYGSHIPDKIYFLTIQASNPIEILLQVTSKSNGEIKPCLENLYDIVMSISEEAKIEKINNLIEGIK